MLALGGTAVFTVLSLLTPLLIRHLVDRIILPGRWEALPLIVFLIFLVPAPGKQHELHLARDLVQWHRRFRIDRDRRGGARS